MTDNRTTELLPCPFCSSEPDLLESYGGWYIRCSCGVSMCENYSEGGFPVGEFVTEAEAIAAWNARVTHGTLTAEQVREAIERHVKFYEGGDYDEQAIADELNVKLGSEVNGETSDGYHTFNELYHHRAVLFSVIVRDHRELAWKARKHHDGTMYEGMFIVGIETPKGQATYHYDIDPYWEMFDCEEREFAPEWDGHTSDEAIARIAELGGDDGYEAKMDALLCRLTNSKWSKSRAYDLDFMESCVNEEFEALYSEEQFSAPVSGTLTAEQVSKATYAHSIHADCADADWQAIADELNAERREKSND